MTRTPSILDLDATALAQAIRAGTLSCLEVTQTYLERLDALGAALLSD